MFAFPQCDVHARAPLVTGVVALILPRETVVTCAAAAAFAVCLVSVPAAAVTEEQLGVRALGYHRKFGVVG